MHICPKRFTCGVLKRARFEAAWRDECPHSVPHDPRKIDDDCLDEPCPEYWKIGTDVLCIKVEQDTENRKRDAVYNIKLNKDLFEI